MNQLQHAPLLIVINILSCIINIGLAYHSHITTDYTWAYIHTAIGTSNLTVALFLFLDEMRRS